LLTGADGFLGINTIHELINRTYTVRAFLEPQRHIPYIANLKIEKCYGNILNYSETANALQGCDAVIHTAACTDIWPAKSEKVRNVNITGTKNIISAAIETKIKRLVYIGTANTFSYGTKEKPGNESGNNYMTVNYGIDYISSKSLAHKMILDAVKQKRLPAVIVNPTYMLGPYDSKPGPGAMIRAVYKKKIPGYTMGGRNFIYVRDAACGIANALTLGRIGESYILGNENLTYQEIFNKIANVAKVNPPRIRIPDFLIKVYGLLGSIKGFLTGIQPTVSYPMACISCDRHFYSSDKAVKELQLPQTNIDIAIHESFLWLKENGYLDD
jgi:dihydroflavonol-4-reductase